MKARDTVMLLGLAALVAIPIQAQAPQTPLSLEVHAGLGVPLGALGEHHSPGFGLGVAFAYRVSPMFDLYAGYNWQSFAADDDPWSEETGQSSDSGFSAGGRLNIPDMPSIRPWISAGVLANRYTVKWTYTDPYFSDSGTDSSDFSLGFELGAGLALFVGPQFSITPAVGYRQYTPRYRNEPTSDALNYIRFQLGGMISF